VRKVLLIITTTVAIFIGYKLGYSEAIKVNEKHKKDIVQETLDNYPVPECDEGKCPTYQYFDVDSDGKDESIALEPIGMTQFAGRVFVIDEGKVTFVSKGGMFIGVRPIIEEDGDHENENGFIIHYSKVSNASSNKDIFWDYYKYIDGKYILEKTTPAEI
jgi:hypothetical protein